MQIMLDDYPDTDFWTSGKRPRSAKTWHWLHDPKSINDYGFENWDIGQPDWNERYDEGECIFLGHKSRFDFKWHDHRCFYNAASYVCEYQRNPVDEENDVKDVAESDIDEDKNEPNKGMNEDEDDDDEDGGESGSRSLRRGSGDDYGFMRYDEDEW